MREERVATSFRFRPGTMEGLRQLAQVIDASQAEVIERLVRHACRDRGIVLPDDLPAPRLDALPSLDTGDANRADGARVARLEMALEGLHSVFDIHGRRLAQHLDDRDREAIARAGALVAALQAEEQRRDEQYREAIAKAAAP